MRKILAIDDDPMILELIESFFQTHQMEVKTLEEGSKAITTIIQYEPDLIILDINLPGISGMDLLKMFKSHAMVSFIPVIMLTGQAAPNSQISGLVSGADDYVIKPFDLNVLYARVISVMRRSLLLTRNKYSQLNLLRYLIRRYEKRDYKIYTKLLTEYEAHPNYWRSYIPDLIAEKGQKYRCYNLETTQSLLEETFLERMKAMAEIINAWHKPVELNLIVRTKENEGIAHRLISENNLPISIKLIKKSTPI